MKQYDETTHTVSPNRPWNKALNIYALFVFLFYIIVSASFLSTGIAIAFAFLFVSISLFTFILTKLGKIDET